MAKSGVARRWLRFVFPSHIVRYRTDKYPRSDLPSTMEDERRRVFLLNHPARDVSIYQVMNISAFRQPENVGISGCFYCAFDPITRQIQLTVEATSVEEAQQRMVAVAGLCGFTKAEELRFVVLEDAPREVPTFLTAFFVVPRLG